MRWQRLQPQRRSPAAQSASPRSQASPIQAVPQRIGTLQYLRAVAALSVVLDHASIYTNVYTGDPSFMAAFGNGFGTFGVLVFFALSGYLMTIQAKKMARQPMLFMVHRLVRIYPIFWTVCLIRIVVAYRISVAYALNQGGQFDPLALMLSPVGERDYPLGVEWTLVYELAFYIFVCALIVVRLERWISLIGAVWLLSILLHICFYGQYSPQFTTSLLRIPMADVCGAFAAGLVVPAVLAKNWIGPAALPLGAFMLALANLPNFAEFSTVIAAIGCAALVGWAASQAQGSGRSRVLGCLGDWSYAIYLVHVPILMAVGVFMPRSDRLGIWTAMVVLTLIVAPLFGMGDIALHGRLRRVTDRWGRKAQASVLVAFAGGFVGCMALSVAQRDKEAETFGAVTLVDGPVIETLERAGYHQDDRLDGNLDSVARVGSLTYVSGWVADPQDLLNRTSMLLVVGNTSTVAMPRSYRFDVAKVIGLARSVAPAAFRKAIPDAACLPAVAVRAVAISQKHKIYHALNAANCPA